MKATNCLGGIVSNQDYEGFGTAGAAISIEKKNRQNTQDIAVFQEVEHTGLCWCVSVAGDSNKLDVINHSFDEVFL